jgi:NAD(P)-dependent dehydrogenase (short-subunit alcohol dehydrogenase family)
MTYAPFDLTGRVSVITGGNGGIGLGMAEALAASGAGVAIWGTNEDKNAAALSRLKVHGTKVIAKRVDVSDEEAVNKAMAETHEEMGRIDQTIANAGIGHGVDSFLNMTGDQMRRLFSVNIDGMLFTLREGARYMVSRAKEGELGGSLVGVASLAAIEGAAHNQHYAASKGAVVSSMKSCAVEFGRYGITANSILPGWIATDMTAGAQSYNVFTQKVISRVPIGRRWGKPEEFGGVAVYLASSAATFHSGDSFVIDGGYSVF